MKDIQLLYAEPYDEVRELCHILKDNTRQGLITTLPERIAYNLAAHIPPQAVLIPIPGHLGNCDETFQIASQIDKITSRTKATHLLQPLSGSERESLCERKRAGLPTGDIDISFFFVENEKEFPENMSKRFPIVLIDNVLDTGRTAQAAQKAIGRPCGLITLGYTGNAGVPMPERYYEVVRFDNQGPDQQTFEQLERLYARGHLNKAIDLLGAWDYGKENIDVARVYDKIYSLPTDTREKHQNVLREKKGTFLCYSNGPYYKAYYLTRQLPPI